MAIIQGIAAGVGHLHEEGIVHRDLAARNVLLDSTLVPKIGDFGMSRVVDSAESGSTMNNLGPVAWMSPESLKNSSYSKKSDVWSFGICVWECATQDYPHKGINLIDLALKIRETGTTPPISDAFPRVLKTLCQQCWSMDPPQRPDMNAIFQSLQNALTDVFVARASVNMTQPQTQAPPPQQTNIGGEGFYQNLNGNAPEQQQQQQQQTRTPALTQTQASPIQHTQSGLGMDYANVGDPNAGVTSMKPGETRNSDYLNI